MTMLAADIEALACTIIYSEKNAWEDAQAFVTRKVTFRMRNLIEQLRKNYYGVFDDQLDATTGQKKIWIPLTESIVEAVRKNIDLDTKDINIRAKKPDSIGLAMIVRAVVRNKLEAIMFGEKLDEAITTLAIDGTVVWATEEVKKIADVRIVDLLNIYIDPTAPSIAEADSIIERIVMPLSDAKKLATKNNWMNVEKMTGNVSAPRYGDYTTYRVTPNNMKYAVLYKRRGLTPLSIFTGEDDDKEVLVPAEVIVSGNAGSWVFHDATKRKDNKDKGYEECRYSIVPGRWYGRGPSEKLMMLQLYLNTIVNIRRNRALVSQLGLYKIRRGSGITPQMIGRLGANGAILVNDIKDIEQFVIQEASQASYNDENNIYEWSQRVTSAFEAATGEQMPASTPATNAAIQSQGVQTQFGLVKEYIGMWLERWLKNQFMPIVMKNLTRGEVIRITGETDEIRDLDERVVHQSLGDELDKIIQQNEEMLAAGGDLSQFVHFDPEQVMMERERALSGLGKMGSSRYTAALHDIDFFEYDAEVDITNEKVDKGVLSQNLVSMLPLVPQYADQIVQMIADLSGLPPFKKPTETQLPPQMQPGMQPQGAVPGAAPAQTGTQNPAAQMTAANTMQNGR